MSSLIRFPDNYGAQTGLGTTDLEHLNMPIGGKLILKSGFLKKLGSHDLGIRICLQLKFD